MSNNNGDNTCDQERHVIHLHKEYGIGIDCHSKFIQVSVIVRVESEFIEFQKSFSTDPKSIDTALVFRCNHIFSYLNI